jgi:CubicO group peptidase (beta-lactamase class C family)
MRNAASTSRMRIRVRCAAALAALLMVWAAAPQDLRLQAQSRVKPDDVGLSSERLKRLSAALNGYVKDEKLAGGVLLVARRGKVAYVEAFGQRDRESRSPMREDTMFRIASQSKALVSAAVLMLQEEGRLLIADPVGKYLPEFRQTTVAVARPSGGYDVVKAKRPITIRDLLTHTSGIGYGGGVASDKWEKGGITGWYFADRDEPIAATVSRMAALPFDAQPGEQWIYGYNTDILGALAERVSGQPLDELLRTRILAPLGMSDTHFYVPESKKERLATVYSMNAAGRLERTPDQGGMVSQGAYVAGPKKSFSGGAGLVSTASDYGRFLQMILNGGELEGKRLLSRKTVELMTTNHLHGVRTDTGGGIGINFDGLGFGLGFSVVTDLGARGIPGSVGEFGWGGAYHSSYWVDPKEQLVVVYLTQLLPAGDVDDHAKMRALLYQALE